MKKINFVVVSIIVLIFFFTSILPKNSVNSSCCMELISFTATHVKTGVLLEWEMAHHAKTLGFELYRSNSINGVRKKINKEMIVASVPPGSLIGAFYVYKDKTANKHKQYFYWLGIIDIYCKTTFYKAVAIPLTKR